MKHDARDARNKRPLPDAAMWEIVCNPTMPAPQLAPALGTNAGTVRNARYRFRHQGRSCRVAFVPSAACGELVTVGGHVRRDRVYHRTCKPAALKAVQRAIDRHRWERADVHERNRLFDMRTAYEVHHQERTRAAATQSGARWAVEDVAVLIEHPEEVGYRLAEMLGRTLYAVRGRQQYLRRRGLL